MTHNIDMKEDVRAIWVEALESGKYPQGKDALAKVQSDGNVGFCCLGVLCELAVEAGVISAPEVDSTYSPYYRYGREENDTSLPAEVMEWSGIEDGEGGMPNFEGMAENTLAGLNDSGMPFVEIAKIIKA